MFTNDIWFTLDIDMFSILKKPSVHSIHFNLFSCHFYLIEFKWKLFPKLITFSTKFKKLILKSN
jgi:hypothetical protein